MLSPSLSPVERVSLLLDVLLLSSKTDLLLVVGLLLLLLLHAGGCPTVAVVAGIPNVTNTTTKIIDQYLVLLTVVNILLLVDANKHGGGCGKDMEYTKREYDSRTVSILAVDDGV